MLTTLTLLLVALPALVSCKQTTLPPCDFSSALISDCAAQLTSTWTVAQDTELRNAQITCTMAEGNCIIINTSVHLKASFSTILAGAGARCIYLNDAALDLDGVFLDKCGRNDYYCGAVHGDNSSLVTIKNSRFYNNRAMNGGAICAARGGLLKMSNSYLSANTASGIEKKGYGGAVHFWLTMAENEVSNCTFNLNSANQGAAISIFDSYVAVTDCIFDGNSATVNGGGIDISTYEAESNVDISNCKFSNNVADGLGNDLSCAGATGVYSTVTVDVNTYNGMEKVALSKCHLHVN